MRLIDADVLLEKVKEAIKQYAKHRDILRLCGDVKGLVMKAPTIEAEPVQHGRWERTSDGAAYCTACKRKMNPSQYGYAFCGLCGAKMDGDIHAE